VPVAIAVSLFVWYQQEPRFAGRSASEWVRLLVRRHADARPALLALGPGAVPALARAVERKHRPGTGLSNSLRTKLPAPIRRLVPSNAEVIIRGDRAVEVLFELGTNAAPAVPALIREELRHEAWDLSVAHAALVRIGGSGAPQLSRVLRSSDPRERVAAARYLGLAGPEATAAAPALARLIPDADPLVRTEALVALTRIGPTADAALPALRDSLADADPDSCILILEALWKIGGDSRSTTPLLTSILADRTSTHRARAAVLLGEMGSAAAPALPTLSNVLHEEFSYTRVQAQEAVARIERSLNTAAPPVP